MSKKDVAEFISHLLNWVPLLSCFVVLLPQLGGQVMNCFLCSEYIPLMAVLETENEIFLKLIIAVDKLKDLLIALHSKGLEKYKDRNEFSETTGTNVHPSIFDEQLAHRLGINGIGDDSSNNSI
jgi:hypothetical protein